MATIPVQNRTAWRDDHIAKSQIVHDCYRIVLAYAGGYAQWILFMCLVVNIIEVLASVPPIIQGVVLGVQTIALDVGGFALQDRASHARAAGNRAAGKAGAVGVLLIVITMLTLTGVTAGHLFPTVADFMAVAEKVLILARMSLTILYSHTMHELGESDGQALAPGQVTTLEARIHAQLADLGAESRQAVASITSAGRAAIAQCESQIAAINASAFHPGKDVERLTTLVTISGKAVVSPGKRVVSPAILELMRVTGCTPDSTINPPENVLAASGKAVDSVLPALESLSIKGQVRAIVKAEPGLSARQIAARIGSTHVTVGKCLRELDSEW